MIQDDGANERRARRALLRSALIWTPPFVLLTALTAFNLIRALEGNTEVWIVAVLTGLIALLLAFSSLQALRDLFAIPIGTRGAIDRKWSKSDLFFLFPGHYVLVHQRIFRVPKATYRAMPDVDGWIDLLHYPYSNTVVDWRALTPSEIPLPPPAEEPPPAEQPSSAEFPPIELPSAEPPSAESGWPRTPPGPPPPPDEPLWPARAPDVAPPSFRRPVEHEPDDRPGRTP